MNFNLIGILSLGLSIAISSCKKEEPVQLATLTTSAITSITATTAVSGGDISNSGGGDISAKGVVWSSSPNPTTTNSQTSDGSGSVSYTSNLTGLTANTTYYVRAYVTNSAGTAYGNQLSFTTTGGGSGIVSNPGAGVTFNGYTYSSIVLGNGQEWMAENLKTTTYANGDPIPNVTEENQWGTLFTGAWSHYNNDSQYENPYGKLYNWYTVNDSRNVCPTGWHVPSDAEWTVLTDYLGGNTVAGVKMKTTTGWNDYNGQSGNGTNESGFSGLPGGNRYNGSGGFFNVGYFGYWWSSTENDSYDAWYRTLSYNFGTAGRSYYYKQSGLSVRCLRD